MTSESIILLIMGLAPVFGVDPKVAVAVATAESSLNPAAHGEAGEIGLFQIMPNIAKKKGFTKKQLLDPVVNTYVGLQMLQDAKENCIHKKNLDYLVCYNYGAKNALKVKHPSKFPYVKRVRAILAETSKHIRTLHNKTIICLK